MIKNIINRIIEIIKNNSGIFLAILAANVFNNITAFVIRLIAMNVLSTESFAQLGLAISFTLTTSFVTDLGLCITLVRLYNTTKDEQVRNRVVAVNILFKSLLILIVAFGGIPLQDFVLIPFLPVFEGSGNLVFFALLSGTLLSFWTTVRALEQAKCHFVSYTVYTLLYGSFRVVMFIIAVFIFKIRSPVIFMLSIYGVPLSVLVLCTLLFNKSNRAVFARMGSYFTKDTYETVIKKTVSYGSWVALSVVLYTSLLQIPQFIMGKISSKEMIALYSAGLTFIAIFELINVSLRTIILPKITSLHTREERDGYKKQLLRKLPIFFFLAAMGIAGVCIGQHLLIVWGVLNESYRNSIHIFIILAVGTMITMYLGLFNTLVHSYGTPMIEGLVNLGRAVLLIGLLLLQLLVFDLQNVVFVAVTFIIVQITGELVLFYFINRLEKNITIPANPEKSTS